MLKIEKNVIPFLQICSTFTPIIGLLYKKLIGRSLPHVSQMWFSPARITTILQVSKSNND